MKRFLIYSTLILSLIGACKSTEKHVDLKAQVISMHDSVMAKNSALIAKKIVLDSLASANPAAKKAASLLSQTEESMMEWMRNFQPDKYETDTVKRNEYLGNQLLQVQALDTLYSTRLHLADSIINSTTK